MEEFLLELFGSEEGWRAFYTGLNIPIILAVSIIAQATKRPVPESWRPAYVILLGAAAAFAVQPVAPFALTWNNWLDRVLRYAGGAVLAFALRTKWMPKGLLTMGGNGQ